MKIVSALSKTAAELPTIDWKRTQKSFCDYILILKVFDKSVKLICAQFVHRGKIAF